MDFEEFRDYIERRVTRLEKAWFGKSNVGFDDDQSMNGSLNVIAENMGDSISEVHSLLESQKQEIETIKKKLAYLGK